MRARAGDGHRDEEVQDVPVLVAGTLRFVSSPRFRRVTSDGVFFSYVAHPATADRDVEVARDQAEPDVREHRVLARALRRLPSAVCLLRGILIQAVLGSISSTHSYLLYRDTCFLAYLHLLPVLVLVSFSLLPNIFLALQPHHD